MKLELVCSGALRFGEVPTLLRSEWQEHLGGSPGGYGNLDTLHNPSLTGATLDKYAEPAGAIPLSSRHQETPLYAALRPARFNMLSEAVMGIFS